jgi:hypothetical protein
MTAIAMPPAKRLPVDHSDEDLSKPLWLQLQFQQQMIFQRGMI